MTARTHVRERLKVAQNGDDVICLDLKARADVRNQNNTTLQESYNSSDQIYRTTSTTWSSRDAAYKGVSQIQLSK